MIALMEMNSGKKATLHLQEKIKANGGKLVSSVSAKVNYLLAGENMGPAKLEKASKLGVKILSEQEFLDMLVSTI